MSNYLSLKKICLIASCLFLSFPALSKERDVTSPHSEFLLGHTKKIEKTMKSLQKQEFQETVNYIETAELKKLPKALINLRQKLQDQKSLLQKTEETIWHLNLLKKKDILIHQVLILDYLKRTNQLDQYTVEEKGQFIKLGVLPNIKEGFLWRNYFPSVSLEKSLPNILNTVGTGFLGYLVLFNKFETLSAQRIETNQDNMSLEISPHSSYLLCTPTTPFNFSKHQEKTYVSKGFYKHMETNPLIKEHMSSNEKEKALTKLNDAFADALTFSITTGFNSEKLKELNKKGQETISRWWLVCLQFMEVDSKNGMVDQGYYQIVSSISQYPIIYTSNIQVCVGLALQNEKDKVGGLAHIDGDNIISISNHFEKKKTNDNSLYTFLSKVADKRDFSSLKATLVSGDSGHINYIKTFLELSGIPTQSIQIVYEPKWELKQNNEKGSLGLNAKTGEIFQIKNYGEIFARMLREKYERVPSKKSKSLVEQPK